MDYARWKRKEHEERAQELKASISKEHFAPSSPLGAALLRTEEESIFTRKTPGLYRLWEESSKEDLFVGVKTYMAHHVIPRWKASQAAEAYIVKEKGMPLQEERETTTLTSSFLLNIMHDLLI